MMIPIAKLSKFPTVLKKARKKLGWTQLDLSKRTSISRSEISHYERGYALPTLHKLALLEEILQTSLWDKLKE